MGRIRKNREAHIFALYILYIMVCEENSFDLNQDRIKNACIFEIFLGKVLVVKVLVVRKIVVPLHPLSGSNP